jgi:hypothetical protein
MVPTQPHPRAHTHVFPFYRPSTKQVRWSFARLVNHAQHLLWGFLLCGTTRQRLAECAKLASHMSLQWRRQYLTFADIIPRADIDTLVLTAAYWVCKFEPNLIIVWKFGDSVCVCACDGMASCSWTSQGEPADAHVLMSVLKNLHGLSRVGLSSLFAPTPPNCISSPSCAASGARPPSPARRPSLPLTLPYPVQSRAIQSHPVQIKTALSSRETSSSVESLPMHSRGALPRCGILGLATAGERRGRQACA